MNFNAPGETGWQALRYVARQMNNAECESFEERLAADQTAREAVAQAVELAHCTAVLHAGGGCPTLTAPIAVTAPVVAASSRPFRTWFSLACGTGLGIAACLALMAAWNASQTLLNSNDGNAPAPQIAGYDLNLRDQATDHLSQAWSDMESPRVGKTPAPLPARFPNLADETDLDAMAAASDNALLDEWLVTGLLAVDPNEKQPTGSRKEM